VDLRQFINTSLEVRAKRSVAERQVWGGIEKPGATGCANLKKQLCSFLPLRDPLLRALPVHRSSELFKGIRWASDWE